MTKLLKLLGCITLCEGVGITSSLFTIQSIPTWYATLNKPFFSPPGWIFGPAWTLLYALMGVSLFLMWTLKTKKVKLKNSSIQAFMLQLAANFLWSILFFGLHSPVGALIDILILWIFILITIMKFYKLSKIAGYLLIPYLLWVSFATLLNLSIAVLNK